MGMISSPTSEVVARVKEDVQVQNLAKWKHMVSAQNVLANVTLLDHKIA